ncbi:hypothetical protein C0995_012086 [Termitomyces sp. Mi166|nr:hypothetical protein C0995_012086 [Termitomyces sp. Mi166\
MALSRTARISLLLAIDILFFFVELIIGYAVGSLALVADSFHMLKLSEVSSLYDHPVAVRASIVQQAQELSLARSLSPTCDHSAPLPRISVDSENLSQNQHSGSFPDSNLQDDRDSVDDSPPSTLLSEHTPLLQEHRKTGTGHGHNHSHSHGSMNMRALILHVMGDALGNVGVISTGLVIWLTQWSFKYYFDPTISLVITAIIASSALPLVRSASFILLQSVPTTISLDGVRDSILEVDGVLSVHELHVWQLSESKVIGSVHVLTSQNHDFMPIAVKIRKVLHHHGIHSSTIQPEYMRPGTDYTKGKANLWLTNNDFPLQCLDKWIIYFIEIDRR